MPSATFELVREGACVVVRIAVRWTGSPWEIEAPLPAELAAFTTGGSALNCKSFPADHPFHGRGYAAVWLDLAKDHSGVDLTPMLTAADWLRDRGWDIEPYGWCKSEMERRQAV